MALTINLSPELERRLAAEAARRHQGAEELARAVLEEWLSHHAADATRAFLAALPRLSPEEVQAFLREHGAKPVERFEDLLCDWSEDDGDEEFDVDSFLNARRDWQRAGFGGCADAHALPRSSRIAGRADAGAPSHRARPRVNERLDAD